MKIAVITGASSGLGKEYVNAICSGAFSFDEIWLIARRRQRLEEISAAYPDRRFRIITLDLTRDEALAEYESALKEADAQVALLINNAGYGKLGNFDAMSADDTAGMINLNCRALTVMTGATLAYMQNGARIINICSIAAFTPNPRMAVYCSTKAYVFSFTKALREELKSRGINVTAVCPGPMDTEFLPVANISPGSSKTFDTLPRVKPEQIAVKSLAAAYRGRAVYTGRFFYKFYRVLSKLIPHNILMKFSAA